MSPDLKPDSGSNEPRDKDALVVTALVWCLLGAMLLGLAFGGGWAVVQLGGFLRTIGELPPPDTYVEEVQKGRANRDALAGATGEAAETAIIANPAWRRRPLVTYPMLAMRQGVEEGRVKLQCNATPAGDLRDCRVVEEEPANAGFGEAALRGAQSAQIHPRVVDGEPVPAIIRFNLRFRMAD